MTAIRTARAAEGKFVQIANGALQDRRLTFLARGILAYVLSLPPEHRLTAEWLETQTGDSRRNVRAALHELEQYGYYRKTRKSGGRGVWIWEQVISDAPLPCDDATETGKEAFPQVSSSDHHSSDVDTSDVKRPDKTLNTEDPKHEVQEMAQERASRRAHASSASANWTVDRVVRDVREAIAQVHGDREAEELSDGQLVGFFYTYVKRARPRDLVAYVRKIIGDGSYLETFMANVEAVCIPCLHWESECKCPTTRAA